MSGLVTTNYGIHIIKCTDVFTAPEEVTSMDQIPVEFTDSIKKSIESSSRSQAYSDWYAGYKEAPKSLSTTCRPMFPTMSTPRA